MDLLDRIRKERLPDYSLKFKMPRPNFSLSISGGLMDRLKGLVKNANEVPHNIDAILSIILAATYWEAKLNETLLSRSSSLHLSKSQFQKSQNVSSSIERLDILDKTILLPEILFQKTFDSSNNPYQHFFHLIKLRNGLIHFKMHDHPEKSILYLRSLELTLKPNQDSGIYTWTQEISTGPVASWAMNTVLEMTSILNGLIEKS